MDNSEFTMDNCRNTLLTVARWIRAQYPEVEDLCVFASGFGAYMTLLCLDELIGMPGKVKLVVQTPSVLMHETLLRMTGNTQATLQAAGSATFRSSRPLEVSYQFYMDMQEHIALVTYPIPILILHGEQDKYIPMDHVQQFHRINEQSKLVIIPGTTHRFLEEGAWDMVLDLTRDWFTFEQVLLSDWD